MKSPYYHRVLTPTDSPCSNDYLLSLSLYFLSFSTWDTFLTPHRVCFDPGGWVCCLPVFPPPCESLIFGLRTLAYPKASRLRWISYASFSLRTIPSPFRRGAPRAHWPELALAESAHRASVIRNILPILRHLFITKGSLGYLSSMYFSTSLVLGEVAGPFPEIESWE